MVAAHRGSLRKAGSPLKGELRRPTKTPGAKKRPERKGQRFLTRKVPGGASGSCFCFFVML